MGKKIQCIGRYVMEGVALGKGTFARVELATHDVTAIKVAVKVIDTKKIKEEYILKNLYREARIMAHLRHPNIIRLYETLRATTLYCIVTEYAGGGELLAHIKSQEGSRLTESHARPFIRQLVSALHYLNDRNVVHRDLKMENIMLDEKKKNIKIIDFGLSAIWKDIEPLKTHCGSPEYAAPELFVVGKTYGPEIDIWSFGIITYAMTIGKLPFSTPFQDEYQRQRMLQQIQKGLSSYHDREMQMLTPDCRNLLHQLIEPNPELRIPLSEVEKHPWLTRNGKYPFCPYQNPPRDKLMHHQAVAELAFMRGLKKNKVEEDVSEKRGNDLSAMYNMIMDEKKKKAGFFDRDHTTKKVPRRDRESRSRSKERDKIHTPDGGRGKDIRTKSGAVKKVPNKSTTGKAGAGSKASMTPIIREPKCVTLSGDRAQFMDSEKVPEPPALSSPKHKPSIPTPGANSLNSQSSGKNKDKEPTANGPTRIPLSQRRQPPPKLNLTLDLSIPYSLPSTSAAVTKKPLCATGSVDSAARVACQQPQQQQQQQAGSKCRAQGIEASSGVPPRLSPQASKIPVLSPNKQHSSLIGRLERHLPAPCRPSSFQHTLRSPWHKPTSLQSPAPQSSDIIGATVKDNGRTAPGYKALAPKATPEDSLIDSYSTSSEEDRNQLCQLLEEREDFDVEDATDQKSMQTALLNNMANYAQGQLAMDEGRDRLDISATGSDVSKDTLVRENPSELHVLTKPLVIRHKLLQGNLGSSEQFDSGDSSQFSSNAHSAVNIVHYTGSGSSLPANFHQHEAGADRTESDRPTHSACFFPEVRSDSAPADGLLSSHKRHPSMSLTLSCSDKLVPPSDLCQVCGVSPSSPTYTDKHSKFCHTGAHALDVFFSPDEVPSPMGQLWRPVASSMEDSPTRGTSAHSPLFDSPRIAKAQRVPMQMALASAECFTDDEYEEEDVDMSYCKPLLPQPHKCHSPLAVTSNPIKPNSQLPQPSNSNNVKKTVPSKPKSKSANTTTSRTKRLSKNGVYTAVPDTTMSLEPRTQDVLTSSSSSSVLATDAEAQDPSADKLASCNAAKVHPLEKSKEESKSLRSRIPRPSVSKFGRLQVLSLLHPDKNKDKNKRPPATDSQNNSPKSTPEKKSDTDRLLRQIDPRTKQYTWRQSLSHILRLHRSATNSNNNLAPPRSNKKASNSRKTAGSASNSMAMRKLSAENNSNHGTPNKSRKNSKETYFQEMDSKWTASTSPLHKCNSLKVSPSPVPSSCPSQSAPLYDVSSSIPDCLHRGSKALSLGWRGCKECARSDQSSDEGPEVTAMIPLEERVSDIVKEKAIITNSNNISKLASHMTSHV